MRQLRAATKAEFDAFVAAYTPPLVIAVQPSGLVSYTDSSDGTEWPENLVAAYSGATGGRRPSGWRIPAET